MYVPGRKEKRPTGSDEVKTEYCDHCRLAKQTSTATKYCPNCQEFLCPSCSLIHTGAKSTKAHKLQDVDSLSKREDAVGIASRWQECPIHTGEELRLFCKSHNALYCLICSNKHHKSCKDTALISDLAKDISKNKEFKTFKADLKKVESDKATQERILKSNEKKYESEHDKTVKSIETMAERAHQCIERLKNNTMKVAEQSKNKNEEKLKKIDEKLKGLDTDLEGIMADIEREEKSQQPERVFIAWKNSQRKAEHMKTEMGQLTKNNAIATVRLNPTEEIDTLLNAKSVLGTLSEAPVTLNYVGVINVKSPKDPKNSLVSGIAIVSPSQMIISDFDNMNVKAINMADQRILQTRQYSEVPITLALLNGNNIGVPLFKDKAIRLLSADEKLDHTGDIKVTVGSLCLLQEQKHGYLIVSQHQKVQVLDSNGSVIREFITDASGKPLFKWAAFLAISPDQSTLYVTDREYNTVTCLTLDGEVKAVYRDPKLQKPTGVTVDDEGHVLVCSMETHCIHVLTADCVKLNIISLEKHKLKYPGSIHICPYTGRLYLSSSLTTMSDSNSVKVFELI